VRRTIRCAMDANTETPESREFTTNPLAAISQARGQYVAAILTIARAYVVAGRPNALTPLASFEEWSRLIREPLVWLACADPVATMDSLRQIDPKAIERQTIFEIWKSEIGVGRERAYLTAELVSATESRPALREALLTIATQRFGDKIDPKALGKWLGKHENTLAAKCKLLVDRTNAARPRWYLEAA
jgi:putative DNA primase/helicase